ncbi:MAG: hypothetical protein ACREVS_13140, partial [Burkholderiales bacterium]
RPRGRARDPAPADCATPIERIVELGRRLGADATPTCFLPNGGRFKGAMPIERVEALLDAAASATGRGATASGAEARR